MTRRLTVEQCIEIYQQGIHAGPLLHRDKLEAAVEAPFAGFGDHEAFPTLIQKGARLAYGLAEAQAFQDGNKRLAWLCTVTFFELNHVKIVVDQEKAARVIRALGERNPDGSRVLDLNGLTQWFIDVVTSATSPDEIPRTKGPE